MAGNYAVNTGPGATLKLSPEAAPTLRSDMADLVTKLEGAEYRLGRIEARLFGEQPTDGSTGCVEKEVGDVVLDDLWRAMRSAERVNAVVNAMEARLG